MSNILVTGSSGFLGRAFIRRLLDTEHDIWTIDLLPSPEVVKTSEGKTLRIPGDVGDVVEWLADFTVDIDLAFHFAAPVGGRARIEGDPMYNADSLRIDSVFFRWAIEHCKTVVYPSSSAVYPIHMQRRGAPMFPLTEAMVNVLADQWWQPDEMYGFSKLAAEVLAWKSAAYGLNTLCIRPFSGYGPGQSGDYPVPSIARRAIMKEDPLRVWGQGSQLRDFVHIDDLVGATFSRLSHGVDGYQVMNICSGKGTSFIDVAMICAELVGYRPEVVSEPDMPEGVFRRIGDNRLMSSFYPDRLISLRAGLETVITDARERIESHSDGRKH